ncbi:MAG: L-histidine N(alpha)-methyltransferase [Sphingomonadaceae bacterium]|nr:L-histidine N(alpha)-methyltransferase [Sphingomonadaceae bacterium]
MVEAASEELQEQFRRDVLAGLSQQQKVLPARWFYDRRGSELFEEITTLPEYYLTRTETGILAERCPTIASLAGKARAVVEFGAGSVAKTPILLDCMDASSYVPVDISGPFLRDSCERLQHRYPHLPILPIEADFTRPVDLPDIVLEEEVLGFFPGSTIGNLQPADAVDLLRVMRGTLGNGSMLLIGMDLIKDRQRLIAAYDDASGVTAQFNVNVARRINRELGGTIPIDRLSHKAVWNDRLARIEMHLEAVCDLSFEVCGERFIMDSGETIHTENSHKYTARSANGLLLAGGWDPLACYSDKDAFFAVILASAITPGVTA